MTSVHELDQAGLAAETLGIALNAIAVHGIEDLPITFAVARECADALIIFGHASTYVDEILKDVSLADLPVEQATPFDFVITLKTARPSG